MSQPSLGEAADVSAAVRTGANLRVTASIDKASLGIKFKINEYGSVQIEIINDGSEDLLVGDDMFIWAEVEKGFNVALVMPPHNSIPEDKLSKYVYAFGVSNFSKVRTDAVLWALGPGGDWLDLAGVGGTYQGRWPKTLRAGSNVLIEHRLASWPGIDKGWIATPVLSAPNALLFRILSKIGDQQNTTHVVVVMTSERLESLIHDHSIPVAVREWVACWLASADSAEYLKVAVELLSNTLLDVQIRGALARSLSTQAPPKSLDAINDVLWNTSTPDELQLVCYYSLTWSGHAEANAFIEKAIDHPHERISKIATRRVSPNR